MASNNFASLWRGGSPPPAASSEPRRSLHARQERVEGGIWLGKRSRWRWWQRAPKTWLTSTRNTVTHTRTNTSGCGMLELPSCHLRTGEYWSATCTYTHTRHTHRNTTHNTKHSHSEQHIQTQIRKAVCAHAQQNNTRRDTVQHTLQYTNTKTQTCAVYICVCVYTGSGG